MLYKPKTNWPDNTMYFLTGSTFAHRPYFREDDQKLILLNQIKKIQKNLGIAVSAYSIAMNHYHLKFYLKDSKDLSKIKKLMHGGTSYIYHQQYQMNNKDLWQDRKTIIIPTQEVDHKIMAYIAGNLLKHKEVSTFAELSENIFSSYKYAVDRFGEEFVKHLIHKVIDIDENAEGGVSLSDFE